MQRANVELLAQLEEARINVRIAEHAAEAANLRAAAAEESLTSLLAKETAEAATQAEVALPAATALVEYGSSEGAKPPATAEIKRGGHVHSMKCCVNASEDT